MAIVHVFSILLLLALRLSFTSTAFTRVRGGVEAFGIGFHDVDVGTLRSYTSIFGVPRAILVVELSQVDTSGTAAGHICDSNIKLEG